MVNARLNKPINATKYAYETDYFAIQVDGGSAFYCSFYEYPVENFQQIVELLSYMEAVLKKQPTEGKMIIGGVEFNFKTVVIFVKKVNGKDIAEWSLRCGFNGKEKYLDYSQCYTVAVCLQKCLQLFAATPAGSIAGNTTKVKENPDAIQLLPNLVAHIEQGENFDRFVDLRYSGAPVVTSQKGAISFLEDVKFLTSFLAIHNIRSHDDARMIKGYAYENGFTLAPSWVEGTTRADLCLFSDNHPYIPDKTVWSRDDCKIIIQKLHSILNGCTPLGTNEKESVDQKLHSKQR